MTTRSSIFRRLEPQFETLHSSNRSVFWRRLWAIQKAPLASLLTPIELTTFLGASCAGFSKGFCHSLDPIQVSHRCLLSYWQLTSVSPVMTSSVSPTFSPAEHGLASLLPHSELLSNKSKVISNLGGKIESSPGAFLVAHGSRPAPGNVPTAPNYFVSSWQRPQLAR